MKAVGFILGVASMPAPVNDRCQVFLIRTWSPHLSVTERLWLIVSVVLVILTQVGLSHHLKSPFDQRCSGAGWESGPFCVLTAKEGLETGSNTSLLLRCQGNRNQVYRRFFFHGVTVTKTQLRLPPLKSRASVAFSD